MIAEAESRLKNKENKKLLIKLSEDWRSQSIKNLIFFFIKITQY
jgi:hypothetical protein